MKTPLSLSSIKQGLFKKRNLAFLLTALLLGLSSPGFGFWPLAWLGFLPALYSMRTCSNPLQAFKEGWLWGSVYHGMVFSWFWGLHPLTWMGMPVWMSLLITFLGWGFLTLLEGALVGVLWLTWFYLWRCGYVCFLLCAPLLWACGYWFLNQQPWGLPLGFLAYSQAPLEAVRLSSYALTFWGLEALIVFMNLAIFGLFFESRLSGGLALLVGWGVLTGASQLHPPASASLLSTLNPLIVQGNLSIESERRCLTPEGTLPVYRRLIQQGSHPDPRRPRLVVLPEGALVLPPTDPLPRLALGKTDVLFSGATYMQGNQLLNGVMLAHPEGSPQYFAKRYLVPFGETVPWHLERLFEPVFRVAGFAYGQGFGAGDPQQDLLQLHGFSVKRRLRLAPFICFEAFYPQIAWHYREAHADLLVTVSNLAWYHQHPALEKQFLAANQFRAAEVGVPLILATNTGISAFISAQGQILQQGPSGQRSLMSLQSR